VALVFGAVMVRSVDSFIYKNSSFHSWLVHEQNIVVIGIMGLPVNLLDFCVGSYFS
jgi:hypothetical protein